MIIILYDKFLTTAKSIRCAVAGFNGHNIGCVIRKKNRWHQPVVRPRKRLLVVNWGFTNVDCSSGIKTLNKKILNKKEQLSSMRTANVRVPWVAESVEGIKKYPCLSRLPSSHGGADIAIINNKEEAISSLSRNSDRFFTQLINKKSEFRAHVLGSKVVEITRKVPAEGIDPSSVIAWNHGNGFIQREVVDNPNVTSRISEIAVSACRACGYDFGAVDIILSKDGNFFVLEINSAPSLTVERRVSEYAEYLIGEHNG